MDSSSLGLADWRLRTGSSGSLCSPRPLAATGHRDDCVVGREVYDCGQLPGPLVHREARENLASYRVLRVRNKFLLLCLRVSVSPEY